MSERCKAVGGRAAALRCGGRRCAPTPLRCSGPGGERRTRPRMAGISLSRAAYARCSDRLRSTHRLMAMRNPRAPALLGAAEALRRSPAHGLAGTTERVDKERCEHALRGSMRYRSRAAGSRRGAGGRRVLRLCGAEQRSAAGLERYSATTSTCLRPCTQGRVVEVALRSEQRRAARARRGPPQRSSTRRPPAPLRRSVVGGST